MGSYYLTAKNGILSRFIVMSLLFVCYELSLENSGAKGETSISEETRDACLSGSTIKREDGLIFSPNFPRDYNPNLFCNWTVVAPLNKYIEITFMKFSLEGADSCKYDYLEIYYGTYKHTGARFCGTAIPRDFSTASSEVSIIFKSDGADNFSGFMMSWKFVARCESDEFACWDGTCIPDALHCDGAKDCLDNSDEMTCAQPATSLSECGKQGAAPHFPSNYRILGGSKAIPGSWPWQAQLGEFKDKSRTFLSFCGGTIIHPRLIMTAAHCFTRYKPLENVSTLNVLVSVGLKNGTEVVGRQFFRLYKVTIHPSYYPRLFANDIALIELGTPLVYAYDIRPICLPESDDKSFDPDPGTRCIATGLGDLDPTDGQVLTTKLYQARLPIVDFEHCQTVYGTRKYTITAAQICAGTGEADSCKGDSGGPLACLFNGTWYQVGITSFGRACASYIFPGVYVRVSFYNEWIKQVKLWTDACSEGINLTASTGIVTTPNFPLVYYHDSLCKWTILADPDDQIIVLRFRQFRLSAPCDKHLGDYLNIYDGNTKVYHLCERQMLRHYQSVSGNVTLIFKSDQKYTDRGFLINWQIIDLLGASGLNPEPLSNFSFAEFDFLKSAEISPYKDDKNIGSVINDFSFCVYFYVTTLYFVCIYYLVA